MTPGLKFITLVQNFLSLVKYFIWNFCSLKMIGDDLSKLRQNFQESSLKFTI